MLSGKMFLAFLAFLASLTLFAQVGIQIQMTHQNYIQYDAVHLRMAIRNYSSHPITFGDAQALKGNLTFHLIPPNGVPTQSLSRRPLLRGVILAPGEARTFTFNLQNYFRLYQPGQYQIRAVISHPQLRAPYESNQTFFNIRAGTLLWQREFGLPDYTGSKKKDGKIRSRNFKILTFNDGKSQLYYMMIDDLQKVYALKRVAFDLGPNLKPQYAIDPQARFHILVAVSPKVFAHYIYDQDGRLEQRDVLLKKSTTPFLVSDARSGLVRIDGGSPARKDVDYEEIKDLPFLDEVKEESGRKFGSEGGR